METKFNPLAMYIAVSLFVGFLFVGLTKCSETRDLKKHGITTQKELQSKGVVDSVVFQIDTVDSVVIHYCYDTVLTTVVLSNTAKYVDTLSNTAYYSDSVTADNLKIHVFDTIQGKRLGSAIRYSYAGADTVYRYRTITKNVTEYRTVYKPPPVSLYAYAEAGQKEFSAGLDLVIKDNIMLGYSYSPLHRSHNAKIGIKLLNINRHGKRSFNN